MRAKHFFISVVVIVSVFASRAVYGQSEGTVHGQVAAADRTAVAGATVMLKSVTTGVTIQTTSDDTGRFVFSGVRADHYVVGASAAGFQPRQVTVVLEPRETRDLTFSLPVANLDVSVNVTADAPPVIGTHSPSSTLLTTERLEALPPFQRENLPDAIVTSAPGMIRGHDDFVHIRGHEIALNPLINGVSFWENTHAVFSPGLSAEVIETANVLTGGFPAEYGNRFGGVVDVVTKSGLRMGNRGSATLSGGSAGRRRAGGDLGGARGDVGFYVYGSIFESDRFFSPPSVESIHDSATGGHAFTAVDVNRQSKGLFRAVLMADATNAEIPRTPHDVELRPAAEAEQRTRQQTGIFGWSRASSRAMVNASGYQRWSSTRLLPAEGPLTARADLTRELLTVGGKADLTHVARGHVIKAGVDAVWLRPQESLAYNYSGYRDLTHLLELPHIHLTGPIAFTGQRDGSQVSAFAQDSIRLGSRVTADIGARIDRYSLVVTQTHVSPRVNLAMNAGGGTILHASYNRFFVPPAIEGVLSSSAGLTSTIREIATALPPLRATTEDQFEAGAAADSGPIQLAVTGYYRTTDNPVHTTIWPDSRIYSYASFDRGRAYGLEVKANTGIFARYGVTGYLNYALGRVYFYNPVTGGFITEAAHLTDTNRFLAPMDQTHTLTGGATYRHARTGAWLGGSMEYGSGTPIGHGGADHEHAEGEAEHEHAAAGTEPRVESHLTGNLAFGVDLLRDQRRRGKLTLRLDVENVANQPYVIARESQFSPSQYSSGRLLSATVQMKF